MAVWWSDSRHPAGSPAMSPHGTRRLTDNGHMENKEPPVREHGQACRCDRLPAIVAWAEREQSGRYVELPDQTARGNPSDDPSTAVRKFFYWPGSRLPSPARGDVDHDSGDRPGRNWCRPQG